MIRRLSDLLCVCVWGGEGVEKPRYFPPFVNLKGVAYVGGERRYPV